MADVRVEPTPGSGMESVVSGTEISNFEADERAYEQMPESKETFLEVEQTSPERPPQPTSSTETARARADAAPRTKDDVTVHVEKIMEEGLGTLYASLPDTAKPLFRSKGEEAAIEIAEMVSSFKVKVARVLRLIRDWLLTIPKANRYFLEQEAKIKTDRIIEYADAVREDATTRP
ncbi:hypothetical protein L0Y59_03910 [Candidatus Uhrbacteria bacterium]|nr:hypothetical protein [Candidatus Uhrbacteria bacterium]